MIKALTFDLWGTLIKGSPNYKEKRADLIRTYKKELTSDEINLAFNNIKKSFDENVEKFGISYNSTYLYSVILKELGLDDYLAKDIKIRCESLFVENYPKLYCEDIPDILYQLSKKYELHLISNTLLIDGICLRSIMHKLKIFNYFKSFTFSDEAGVSKPNYEIFKIAHQKILYPKENIMHIGDNYNTDEEGAKRYGFNFCGVNSEKLKYDDIKYLIKNKNL